MKFQLSKTIWWWIEPCGEAPFYIQSHIYLFLAVTTCSACGWDVGGGGCTFTDVNGSSRFLWCVRVLCQPRQLPLSSQNKSNKWSNTIEMECAFVLFCVKRASMYLAMQTIFSLNCSIFTQTRIIRQSCLCHGVELQINCWQSSHKSPAQLQVPERRNPANQIPDSR